MSRLTAVLLLTLTITALTTTACGTDEPAGTQDDGRLGVVASTDVWGSVAGAVGGDLVDVTSIIDDPSADPHSYQLTPTDAATLAGADLVVFNGGGYDEFVEQAFGEGGEGPHVVQAVALAGHAEPTGDDEHGHEHGENEHVWYDLDTVGAVADDIARRLGELRPESSSSFTANAEAFRAELAELTAQVEQLAAAGTGRRVVATEPVAHYLLEDAGLEDATPADFVEAIEEETDPPAAAVAAVQDLVSQRHVAVLVHNPQTETPVVADVVTKARDVRLPIVELTETLPDGQDYVTWMTEQIQALASALKAR